MQSISQLNSTNLNLKLALNETATPSPLASTTLPLLPPSTMDSLVHTTAKYKPVLKPILKAEMYPDRFSHITLTRMEYPEPSVDASPSASSLLSSSSSSSAADASSSQFVNSSNKLASAAAAARPNTRKPKPRNKLRYMTQPITLIEIKESEEQEFNNENYNAMSQPPTQQQQQQAALATKTVN